MNAWCKVCRIAWPLDPYDPRVLCEHKRSRDIDHYVPGELVRCEGSRTVPRATVVFRGEIPKDFLPLGRFAPGSTDVPQ